MDIKKTTAEVEKISKIYSKRFKIKRDSDWYVLKLQEELGELIQSYLMMIGQGRAKGKNKRVLKADFDAEVADVFSHILLLANYFKIDLEKVIDRKWLKYSK